MAGVRTPSSIRGAGGIPARPDTERHMSSTRLSRRATTTDPFFAMSVARRAGELTREGADVIRLSLGEPDSGAPPEVLRALREVADGRPLPYTDALGLPALREAIAGHYRDVHGVAVDPRRVVVTAGASAALLLVSAALVDPGDRVLLGDPSYPCNRQFLHQFGARVALVPTSPATRYQLDLDLVGRHWTPDTRGVLLASPSNPTGTSVSGEELGGICRFVEARGGWRVIDEIYLGLSDPSPDSFHEGGPARTVLAEDPGAIVISSFSKYFGMTGWRLGWAVVPEDMVDAVERLSQNLLICAPTPAQLAALSCFTPASLTWCEGRRIQFRGRREAAVEELARLGLPVDVRPDGAFYVYVDVSGTGLDADSFARRALEECQVALTPGRDFGPLTAATHVRLSCSASESDIQRGIRRLRPLV